MIFKLKTSKDTMEIFDKIGASTRLQPFTLSKLALALSLNSSNKLTDSDFKTNNDGLELNRQTITGDTDLLFKSLISMNADCCLPDDEYFPKYVKAHLDRGAKLLDSEFKYNNKDFYTHLCELQTGI